MKPLQARSLKSRHRPATEILTRALHTITAPAVRATTAAQVIRAMPAVDSTTGTSRAIISKAHMDTGISGEATDHPTKLSVYFTHVHFLNGKASVNDFLLTSFVLPLA